MERFQYHFEPEKGWMNDPNGLVQFRGQYHAFFQYNPHDTKWGPMHWGHAVSSDLLHWEELPIALYPDQPYENNGGCFSGSAIVHEDRLYLFYTSVGKELGQTQSVAVSDDGIHFVKYSGNPVIRSCPVDLAPDFRDPKVFPWNGEFRMVVGSGSKGTGRVLLFGSRDLLQWEFISILYENGELAPVFECPDFFMLDGKPVLMCSKIGVRVRSTLFVQGSFDGSKFTPETVFQPEWGPEFFAPQTFSSDDGRRILIGWFYAWAKELPEGAVSAGALSIPRELYFNEKGSLCGRPVREAAFLLKENDPAVEQTAEGIVIHGRPEGDFTLPCGPIRDLKILHDVKGIEVFVNGGECSASAWLL